MSMQAMLQGLLGTGAGTALDTVSGVAGAQGPTMGSGITGFLDNALPFLAGSPAPDGGGDGGMNLASAGPILSGLLGGLGKEEKDPILTPSSFSARGGPIAPFQPLPQTNPLSLRRR